MLQEYLDQLFDAFKEGICISDVEGTVVHLNGAMPKSRASPAKRCWGIP